MNKEKILIKPTIYVYRSEHLTMEGTCSVDHGPREVEIKQIWVDKYPVTNNDYYHFIEKTKYKPAENKTFLKNWTNNSPHNLHDNNPVVWVSQKDAEAYAEWVGGRLPTDEEWQYIAAGPTYKAWPWGEIFIPEFCNHDSDELKPVNSYENGKSWCGCEDLSGNSWEWTSDIYDDGEHKFALLRGGSFYYAHEHWHVAGGARKTNFHWKMQILNDDLNRASTLGFRCVYENML